MDIQARSLVIIIFISYRSPGSFQHSFALFQKILHHFIIIIVIIHRCNQQRNSPLISLIPAQSYMIGFFGNRFSLQVHICAPAARFANTFFEVSSNGGTQTSFAHFFSICAGKNDIASEKISILLVYIPEIRNNTFGRLAYFIIFVAVSFESSTATSSIIMMTDIFSQDPVIVTKTVRETFRSRI